MMHASDYSQMSYRNVMKTLEESKKKKDAEFAKTMRKLLTKPLLIIFNVMIGLQKVGNFFWITRD